jgi:hypothetical protein
LMLGVPRQAFSLSPFEPRRMLGLGSARVALYLRVCLGGGNVVYRNEGERHHAQDEGQGEGDEVDFHGYLRKRSGPWSYFKY